MIKIIFEVSEDFIRERASAKTTTAMVKEGGVNPMAAFIDKLILGSLEEQIDEGKTEFVVTPDKLDDKSKELYDGVIASVFALAVFSEMDNKKEESDE